MILALALGLNHVTCFGQWDASRYAATEQVVWLCTVSSLHVCSCGEGGGMCTLACWKQEKDGQAEQSQLQDAESSQSNGGSISKPG